MGFLAAHRHLIPAHALHAGDGVAPLSDQDVKPFSALQGLAEQLKGKAKPDPDDGK